MLFNFLGDRAEVFLSRQDERHSVIVPEVAKVLLYAFPGLTGNVFPNAVRLQPDSPNYLKPLF